MSKKGWIIAGMAGGLTALATVAVVLRKNGVRFARIFKHR